MYKQENKHAYINSQNSSPPFCQSSTKGRKQVKQWRSICDIHSWRRET